MRAHPAPGAGGGGLQKEADGPNRGHWPGTHPSKQPATMVQSTDQPHEIAATNDPPPANGSHRDSPTSPNVRLAPPAPQPPSNAAQIQSTKGSYETNPLLAVTEPTSAPNNTPVQSPATSPTAKRPADAPALHDTVQELEPESSQKQTVLPLLPPPRALLQAASHDGGTQPPSDPNPARDRRLQDDNSPISIINRRQIFSTSHSRWSGSSPNAAAHSGSDRESSSDELGVAPQSFYFDKDRSVTDPHVKLDNADEKINISSWLKSKHAPDAYSMSDSAGNGKSSDVSRQPTKGDQFDGLISPQAPRSALSIGSSCGRVMSRDSLPEPPHEKDEDDENYVPPPPPKFINSKLDGVRSRMLLNPRVAPAKIDADMGTASAAAVLSNMRSSPFHFPERPAQFSSRPGSSSFSKSYPRPIIRIHHREHSTGDDENAVLDGDDDDEMDDQQQEDLNGVVKTTGERLRKNSLLNDQAEREVTWNKNGKRINRRLTAATARGRRPKKARANAKSKARTSHADEEGSRLSDDGDESYTLNDYHDEDEEEDEDGAVKTESKSSRHKAGMGSRSRTGCWICRLRKKKCTEERPSCFNCERLNLQCHYDAIKPDFVSDPKKKMLKLLEIKTKTKEAKRNAMRKKPKGES